jgi:hypothetical protein
MQGAGVVGRRAGRYLVYDPVASGGMATVHFGRMLGPVGFSRTVAIKRLHAHLARDPEFVTMFLDEARLAARVQHPNVVSTIDIVSTDGEVFLVMEYVKGESLAGLLRATGRSAAAAVGDAHPGVPAAILTSVIGGILHGLHAAHEALTDRGEPLDIVHRDVSPQNILVGEDGVARLADFGVAKAQWRVQSTQGDKIKGKLSYMAPEQLGRQRIDRRVDVYAASVVLWEGLTGERLFTGDNPGVILHEILKGEVPPPSELAPGIPPALDRLVLRGLSREAGDRYATALEMAAELESALTPAPQSVVRAWVRRTAAAVLEERAGRLASIEATPTTPLDAAADGARGGSVGALRSAETIRALSSVPTAPEMQVSDVAPLLLVGNDATVVDVAAAPMGARQKKRAPWLVAAAAALSLALGSALAWRRAAAPVVVAATPVPSAAPALTPAAPAATAATMATTTAPLTAALPAVVQVVPVAPLHAGRTPVTHPAARSTPRSTPQPQNCDPPYTLDPSSVSSDGQPLKRFKPWCL